MNENITLQSGEVVSVYQQHNMWRADVNGIHFCGDSRQALIESLKYISPVSEQPVLDTTPILSPLDTWVSIINSDSSLSVKQDAWKRLKSLAASNKDAKAIVDAIQAKPVSYLAGETLRNTGKTDFMDVTYEDLVKYVSNLVVRNHLVEELSKSFKIVK